MKVSELITILQEQNPDAEIILASSPAGDVFSVIGEIEELKFIGFESGECEIHIKEFTQELADDGFVEDDFGLDPDAEPCLVFWPVF